MTQQHDYPQGVDEGKARDEWHEKHDNKVSPTNVMFGHKVALTRNVLGWSQEKLAEKVGLSRASIANIEGGRQAVDLDGVEAFCLAFGITPHHFMKGIWFIDGRK